MCVCVCVLGGGGGGGRREGGKENEGEYLIKYILFRSLVKTIAKQHTEYVNLYQLHYTVMHDSISL